MNADTTILVCDLVLQINPKIVKNTPAHDRVFQKVAHLITFYSLRCATVHDDLVGLSEQGFVGSDQISHYENKISKASI